MKYALSAKVVRLTIGVSFLYLLLLLLPAALMVTASNTMESDHPDAVVDLEAGLMAEEADPLSHHHALTYAQESHWSAVRLSPAVLRYAGRGWGAWRAAISPPVPLVVLRFIYYRYTLCPPSNPFLM
jgi:hypothetical protein